MSELARAKNLAPSRRSIIRTAAWSIPAVSIAVAAPAVAASPDKGLAVFENGSVVTGGSGSGRWVEWTIPVLLTDADLTGLSVDFAGSSFNSPALRTVTMFDELGAAVGSWTVQSSSYGTATFNPGGTLPNGPYKIVVNWTRSGNNSGSTSATFTRPAVPAQTVSASFS